MLGEVMLPILALASIPMKSGKLQFAVVIVFCKCVQKWSCCSLLCSMLVGACAQMRKSCMCLELMVMASNVGSDFQTVMSLA